MASMALGQGCNIRERTSTTYDIAIIGSGFAGLPVAFKTTEAGLSTVVIEAGKKLSSTFDYRTSGSFNYPIAAARRIELGGTSARWGGVVGRMWPYNFTIRSTHGHSADWPIRYEDLDPYYCESEKFLCVRGAPYRPNAEPPRICDYPKSTKGKSVDLDLTVDGRKMEFFTKAVSSCGKGPLRLADGEIKRFSELPHGTLLEGLRATRLVTLDGKSISHITVRKSNGEESSITAKRFVVAAGVIESPRLLLMSQSHWFPYGFGNHGSSLGRYFCYHPHYAGLFRPEITSLSNTRGLRSHSLDTLAHAQSLNACNVQLDDAVLLKISKEPGLVAVRLSPDLTSSKDNLIFLNSGQRDAMGYAVPELHIEQTDVDRRTLAYAKRASDQIASKLGGDAIRWVGQGLHSHPSGTCRMSSDADSGVVDHNCRVFGMENLYVSGATVFPTAGATNPTNTIVALALRLGEHLTRQSTA